MAPARAPSTSPAEGDRASVAGDDTDLAPTRPTTEATSKHRHGPKWHRRREEIIDRSAALIARRGFHATSTTELCEANELGKGALYYYIGSKEELLALIHDRVMDEVLSTAEAVVETEGSASVQLARLGEALVGVIGR